MKVTITVDGELARHLQGARHRIDDASQDALREIGEEFVARAEALAPGSTFARSFRTVDTGATVEAGSVSPLAGVLERGRRPGRRPPPQSIRKRTGISAAAAARAADQIEAHGTRGRFTVKRAARSLRADGTVARVARQALHRIVEG